MPFSLFTATLSSAASALPLSPAKGTAGSEDEAVFALILEEARKSLASEMELGLAAQALPLIGMLSAAAVQETPISQAVHGEEVLPTPVIQVPLSFVGLARGERIAPQAADQVEGQPDSAPQQAALPEGEVASQGTPQSDPAPAAPSAALDKLGPSALDIFRPAASALAPPSQPRLAALPQAASQPEEAPTVEAAQSRAGSTPLPAALRQSERSRRALPAVEESFNRPKAPGERLALQGSHPEEVIEKGASQESPHPRYAVREGALPSPQEGPSLRGNALPASEQASAVERPAARLLAPIVRGAEALEKSGQASLRLHLHSQDLGGVEVRLTSTQQGVHVALRAEAAQTGELLQRHLPELRQSLAQAGVHLSGLSVGAGGAQAQQGGGQLTSPHPGRPWKETLRNREVEAPAEPAPLPGIGSTSNIDYRI